VEKKRVLLVCAGCGYVKYEEDLEWTEPTKEVLLYLSRKVRQGKLTELNYLCSDCKVELAC
jgi:hypothetical protein